MLAQQLKTFRRLTKSGLPQNPYELPKRFKLEAVTAKEFNNPLVKQVRVTGNPQKGVKRETTATNAEANSGW